MANTTERIDSHHHLWHYTQAEYGWISDEMASLRQDYLLPQLKSVLGEANVDGTVAVQARQTVEETRWLLELASAPGSPVRGVVGWLPLADASFPSLLDSFLPMERLRGLRHVVQAEAAGFLENSAFNRGISRLQATGLVYDILIYARQLEDATRFVDRHPGQAFVLDHIAKPEMRNDGFAAWSEGFREIARRQNVVCKLSGMVTETDWTNWTAEELHPYFEVALDAFGPERLMIGTDWPVLTLGCSYARWWKTVESWTTDLSKPERDAILGGNAVRVYGLKPAEPA